MALAVGKLAFCRLLATRPSFHHTSNFMDDHTKQLLLLGREHYEKREYDKAEYLLRQAVEKADHFADVHNMLGVMSHSKGRFGEAERCFERAIELNPNYTEAQLNLMVTYNDLGKYDAARQVYGGIRGGGDDRQIDPFAKGKIANMHAETSQAYLDAGMVAEATHELERAVNLCPQFADLRTRLGVLYRDSNNPDAARAQFEAALATNANYSQARVMLGVLLLTSGEEDKAIKHFEQVLSRDPDNRGAQMYLRIAKSYKDKSGDAGAGDEGADAAKE